jgi:3,4-dihydroxy 2-butanone 4-phosphate synthase/GTP cyclohydrolase II
MELGLPADGRDYGIATQILKALGARRIRLMTNNPKKASALLAYGLEGVERVSLEISANGHNSEYLATKKTRLGHLLTLTDRLERQGIE